MSENILDWDSDFNNHYVPTPGEMRDDIRPTPPGSPPRVNPSLDYDSDYESYLYNRFGPSPPGSPPRVNASLGNPSVPTGISSYSSYTRNRDTLPPLPPEIMSEIVQAIRSHYKTTPNSTGLPRNIVELTPDLLRLRDGTVYNIEPQQYIILDNLIKHHTTPGITGGKKSYKKNKSRKNKSKKNRRTRRHK